MTGGLLYPQKTATLTASPTYLGVGENFYDNNHETIQIYEGEGQDFDYSDSEED